MRFGSPAGSVSAATGAAISACREILGGGAGSEKMEAARVRH
jgi:hypothetical protein